VSELPLRPEKGAFLSFLDWLDRPGAAVRNLLSGNFEGAYRQALEAGFEVPDAILPGDAIPSVVRPEDEISGSELVGVDRDKNPILGTAADIGVETLLNPTTYLTFGSSAALNAAAGAAKGGVRLGIPFTKVGKTFAEGTDLRPLHLAGKAMGAGVDAMKASDSKTLSGLGDLLERVGTDGRRALGWMNYKTPGADDLIEQARAAGSNTARAATTHVEKLFASSTPAEQELVGEILHGISRLNPKDRSTWQAISGDVTQRAASRLSGNVPDGVDVERVKSIVDGLSKYHSSQLDEAVAKGAMFDGGGVTDGYLQRSFKGLKKGDVGEADTDLLGNPQAIRQRKIGNQDELLGFLTDPKNADVDLDFNALRSAMGRAGQQGRLVEKATIGKSATGKLDFVLAKDKGLVDDALKSIEAADPDFGYRLRNMFEGMKPRKDLPAGWFFETLHQANRVFKPAVTSGILWPKLSFFTRNQISSLWSTLSVDQARGTIGPATRRAFGNLLGAFDDGFKSVTGARLGKGELTQSIDMIEGAFASAGGVADNAMASLRSQGELGQQLAAALQHGVMDGFVSSEDLLRRIAMTDKGKKVQSLLDFPTVIGRGLEHRLRLGTFLDLVRGKKMAPEEAARAVREVYFNYDITGTANDLFRQTMPFGAYLSQAVKQQGDFLTRNPGVANAVGGLYGGDSDSPLYSYLENQATIPLGPDERGDQQVIASIGMPWESLVSIPTSADDVRTNLIGSAHPLAKSLWSYLSGEDPRFGTPFASYDEIPAFGPSGDIGRYYNVAAGTGLLAPIDAPLRQIGDFIDSDRTPGVRALDLLTGANVVSVDEDRAISQQLTKALEERPDIRQYRSLYSTGGDPAANAALQELREAKQRLREKRAQEADVR